MSPAPTRTASGISDGEAPGASPEAAAEAVGAAPEAVGPAEGLADGDTLGAADGTGWPPGPANAARDPAPWLMRLAKPSRRTRVAAKRDDAEHHGPSARCRSGPGSVVIGRAYRTPGLGAAQSGASASSLPEIRSTAIRIVHPPGGFGKFGKTTSGPMYVYASRWSVSGAPPSTTRA